MKKSYPGAIQRSRGSRIAVSCFYPLSCYPETTDSRGLSEEGSLVPQVGWGRPQDSVRLRRTGASRTNAEERQREGEGTRAEKPRKRRRGSRKASTGRRDRARTGKRKTNKAKWRDLTMLGKEERKEEKEEDRMKRKSETARALGKLKRFSLSLKVLAKDKGSRQRKHTSRFRRRSMVLSFTFSADDISHVSISCKYAR